MLERSMPFPVTVMRLALALVGALASVAHAEDITLARVLAAAKDAPAMPISVDETASAEARIAAAAAWPAPTVRIESNRLTARLVAGVAVPLPILGTIGTARREATAHAATVRAEGMVAQRELRHRIVLAWLELARADANTVALSTAAKQAAELESIAKGRVDAGAGADVDVMAAHAARIRADLAVSTAAHEQDAAGSQLAGLLGWDPLRLLTSAGPLPGGVAALEALRPTLAAHPERLIAVRRIAEADAAVARTRVLRRPALALEIQGAWLDPTQPGTDVLVALSVDLPLFSHVGDQVRAAEAQAAAEKARLNAGDAQLGGELVAAFRRWQAATERLLVLERDVLPVQDKAATLASQAYREGARDLASALLAERDRAAVHTEIAEAKITTATAWIELLLAAGGDLGER